MNNFFAGCRKLETVGNTSEDSVDLSQFKAPYPMSYDSMFRGCTALRKADLSALGAINTNNAVYISHMFYDCTSLEEIDMSNFQIEFSPRNFLVNATALRELKIPDVTKTANLGKHESKAIFQYADKLAYVELSKNWHVYGTLDYLPAKQTWKKTKLSNNTGEEPLNTVKTATELFKQFQPSYAGGWSAEADFDFKGNGGTPEVQTVKGQKNEALDITTIQTPTREGYTFAGWYSEPEGGEVFDNTAKHWTYYAHWTDIEYTLVLDANGGHKEGSTETQISQTVKYSDWIELGKTGFVNEGKVLVGWNTKANGTGVSYSALDSVGMLNPQAGTFTLYAIWGDNAATVSFDSHGGSAVSTINYSQLPANYGVLSISEKAGYTFMGWFTGQNGTGEKLTPETVINGNTDFYPYWASKIIPDPDTGINFMAQWDTGSDSNVTDTGDYLVFHPNNNNQVTATIKVVLMMEGNLQTAVPPKALKLKIPKYVFKDYAGNPVGTDNIATMASDKYKLLTDEGDFYVFTNKVDIRSDFDTFTIDYTVTPRQVKGGYEDENRRFAGDYYKNDDIKVILEVDKSSYELADRTIEQTLGLEFHTLVHTNASKSRSNVTLEWNESWGERPVDADEYFYVTWALISDHSNTSAQRYKLMWDEDTAGREGTIVYTSGAVGYQTGWRSSGRSTAYVVTKHRRDSATAHTVNGDIWVPVENEAVLKLSHRLPQRCRRKVLRSGIL